MAFQKLIQDVDDVIAFFPAQILMHSNVYAEITDKLSIGEITNVVPQVTETRTLGGHGRKKIPGVYAFFFKEHDQLVA